MRLDGALQLAGLTTWDVGLPNKQDFFEYRQVNAPMAKSHPPSLRKPIKVKQPFGGSDGWHRGDPRTARLKAIADLRESLKLVTRQMPTTRLSVPGALYPGVVKQQDWL